MEFQIIFTYKYYFKKIDLKYKKLTFILYSGSGVSKKATDLINKKYRDVKIINLKEPKTNKEELKKLIKK